MIKSIEFYFDFISPYCYIAHKKIRELQKKENIKIQYKPIFLGGLHKTTGITAPAFITSKAKFLIRDWPENKNHPNKWIMNPICMSNKRGPQASLWFDPTRQIIGEPPGAIIVQPGNYGIHDKKVKGLMRIHDLPLLQIYH